MNEFRPINRHTVGPTNQIRAILLKLVPCIFGSVSLLICATRDEVIERRLVALTRGCCPPARCLLDGCGMTCLELLLGLAAQFLRKDRTHRILTMHVAGFDVRKKQIAQLCEFDPVGPMSMPRIGRASHRSSSYYLRIALMKTTGQIIVINDGFHKSSLNLNRGPSS